MEVICGKIVMFFEVLIYSVVVLCQVGEEQFEVLCCFGDYLGIVFQLVDDLFDYCGDVVIFGKNVGDDFVEGKFILLLIVIMCDGIEEQVVLVCKVIQ